MKQIALAFAILTLLTGCVSTDVQVRTFNVIETAKPLDPFIDCKPTSLGFKECIISASPPIVVGNLYNNSTKTPYTNVIILTTEQASFLRETIKKGFYDIFKNNDYFLVGSPDDLFGDYTNDRPELLIGAKIIQVGQNRIISHDSFWSGIYTSLQFQSYIKINWQAFSVNRKKVIFEATTEGYSTLGDSFKCYGFVMELAAYPQAFQGAIIQATESFARNSDFRKLVCSSKIYKENETKYNREFYIEKIENYINPLNTQSSQIRSATVTVITSTGHGSGFFISEMGYALTNAHVVGKDAVVTVRLSTGREFLADVLIVEKDRDVAMIKIEQDGLIALPIHVGDINIGDEVYAMGSPLRESFSSTLTKGIVSALRKVDGLEYIQSDVSIQPGNSGGPLMDKNGNVIGMSVSGMFADKAQTGLNFFVPIQEALDVLNIKFK